MHYELNPEFRPAYELLIKYNDSIGNRDKQLKYINTLMSLDKNYEKNYKYLCRQNSSIVLYKKINIQTIKKIRNENITHGRI